MPQVVFGDACQSWPPALLILQGWLPSWEHTPTTGSSPAGMVQQSKRGWCMVRVTEMQWSSLGGRGFLVSLLGIRVCSHLRGVPFLQMSAQRVRSTAALRPFRIPVSVCAAHTL